MAGGRSAAALLVLLLAALLPLLAAPLVVPPGGVTGTAAAVTPAGHRAAVAAVAAPVAGGDTAAVGRSPGGTAAPDPDLPYVGYLRTTITSVTPTVVTSSTGPSITVAGSMTNTSKGTLYDLRYVWQRGDALAGVKAIKAEIAQPSTAATVVDGNSRILAPKAPPTGSTTSVTQATTAKQVDLAPGATAAFVATIAIGADGLEIDTRGVYGLTVELTGDIGQNGATQYERVGELHLLGTVLSVPLPALPAAGTTPAATATGGRTTIGPSGTGTGPANPVPTTVLWPVVDVPHLGIDGVFLDDSLATSLAPGGRLSGVLSALAGFSTGGAAATLVVDPQLLDEVDRMAAGYRVVATPGAAQPALTPTSVPTTAAGSSRPAAATGPARSGTAATTTAASTSTSSTGTSSGTSSGSAAPTGPASTTPASTGTSAAGSATATATRTPGPPPPGTVAGTGQAAAVAFLATLRAATRTHQVLVLPYSDPDGVAMMRAGLDDQLATLIDRGRSVASRVLQPPPGAPGLITDTLVPVGGAINDATLSYVSAHGIKRAVLAPATVEHAGGPVGAVTVDQSADDGALVAAALTDADVLPQLTDLIARGRTAGLPTRLGTTAALLTGGSLDRTGTPVVLLPARRWTANAAGLSLLGGLLQTLATGKVVAATSLPAVTAAAATPATLDYRRAAEAAELPPSYLARVLADDSALAATGKSLITARAPGSPDAADILDPLRTALTSTAAAALRPNQTYGSRILQTVDDTIAGLRGRVSIVSQSPSTLAASTAPLLITVRNDLPYGVRVKVVVIDGAAVGMTTKDPALEDIPEGGSQQFRIEASVVKAGRFQVHAQIQAADGSIWSAPTTITVSSSAYGALTIVLVVVAGGALTLMVALRLIQRVRNRKRSDDDPAAGTSGGPGNGPGPDSILAAANEPSRRGGGGAPGNPAAGDASVSPASPTTVAPVDEQGEPPR